MATIQNAIFKAIFLLADISGSIIGRMLTQEEILDLNDRISTTVRKFTDDLSGSAPTTKKPEEHVTCPQCGKVISRLI